MRQIEKASSYLLMRARPRQDVLLVKRFLVYTLLQLSPSILLLRYSNMAPTYCLLAVALTLSSYVQAFSPDQCNVTDYGKPNKAACTTLLTSISNLGVGNTSYLFIPAQFPTPAGLSNGTRKNFPVTWSARKFSAWVGIWVYDC